MTDLRCRQPLIVGLAALLAAVLGSPSLAQSQPGEIIAWGNIPTLPPLAPPVGLFKALALGGGHALALRPDGTMVGWGANSAGQSTPQLGTFTSLAIGSDHSVALRTDGTVVCWGVNLYGEAVAPKGTFIQISAGYRSSGGLRPDGTIHVWGLLAGTAPAGSFRFLSIGGGNSAAAIRTDGTMLTWGTAPPSIPGTFVAVKISAGLSAAIRTDGSAISFGDFATTYPAPTGQFVQLTPSSAGHPGGLRSDGTIAAWGPHSSAVLNVSQGRFSFVVLGSGVGMAIKPCYANCDESSVSPYLTANDFICFINQYATAEPSANCDGSTSGALLTANDFVCFLNSYAGGCG